MRKRLLIFLVMLLTSFGGFAQDDERNQPKGLLYENPVGPAVTGYETERTIFDASAQAMLSWKKKNWALSDGVLSTGSYTASSQNTIVSPAITLPVLQGKSSYLNLYLKEAYALESYHDKGIVEISSDNGATWKAVSIRTGRGDWRTSVIDVSAYAGKTVKIALRITADESIGYNGWSVEQLSVKQENRSRAIISNKPVAQAEISGGKTGAGSGDVARTMAAPIANLVGPLDAQRFPRFIFAQLEVFDGNTPMLNLDKPNFSIREEVTDEQGVKTYIPAARDETYAVYQPSGVTRPVDIVFLMDNSGSMQDEQDDVENNVISFVNGLQTQNLDFRLGLCRFGQGANNGTPIFHNNAFMYSDGNVFKNLWGTINTIDGGYEPSWDALYQSAQQFSFRPGAQRVFILITDESITNNNIAYNIIKNREIVIDQLNAAGVRTYAVVSTGPDFDYDFRGIAAATNGKSYNITDNFNGILNDITADLTKTYTVRYAPTHPVFDGQSRLVEITVTNNVQQSTVIYGNYTPGSAPSVVLTDPTLLVNRTAHQEGATVQIEVRTTDWDIPYSNDVRLYYRTVGSGNAYTELPMTLISRTIGSTTPPITATSAIWRANIPNVLRHGVEYYIRASDGAATTIAPEFIDKPGYPYTFAVLPNQPPVLNFTPLQAELDVTKPLVFTAEAIDNTTTVSRVVLAWRKDTDLIFTEQDMTRVGSTNNFSITLPAFGVKTAIEYYIRAIDDFGIATFSANATYPHIVAVGSPWAPPASPVIQTIRVLKSGANAAVITVDGAPIQQDDVIGVFYTDNGVLKLAGSIKWDNALTIQTAAVVGDDPSTSGVKEGFADGEAFTFKIFRKLDGEIYETAHVMLATPPYVTTFKAGRTAVISQISTFELQVIQLNPQLNLVSTYLSPRSPLFSSFVQPLGGAFGSLTDSYEVSYPTLTTHTNGYGYRFYMNGITKLRVSGVAVNPTSIMVPLNENGFIVGTPYKTPQDVEQVFPQNDHIYIIDRYITASNGNLTIETYSPAWDINTWTNKNMEPGRGYYVYTDGPMNFTYPSAPGPHARVASKGRAKAIAQTITSINDYMHVVIPGEAWQKDFSADEVRVYDKQGILLGKAAVQEEGSIITIDGSLASAGEQFYLRGWDTETESEQPLAVKEWKVGVPAYQNHRISVVGRFGSQEERSRGEAFMSVYPNPVETEVKLTFVLEDEGEVSVDVFNIQGTRVLSPVSNKYYTAGEHEVTFGRKSLISGLYLVKVSTGDTFEMKRVVVR